MIVLFRAFSALLSYPCGEMLQALPEIAAAIRSSPLVGPRERASLIALVDHLANRDLIDCEEHYVELFDRPRATSLHLFEHLHGESRDRGQAMVDLKRHYEDAGYELASSELPDYLPVMLEYLSCSDLEEIRDMLGDCAHILRRIGERLKARGSPYAAVLDALLVIAGQAPLTAAPASGPNESLEEIDRDWFEPPAFGADQPSAPVFRERQEISKDQR